MTVETITIPKCPKCGESHKYRLDVDRSMVIKMMTMSDMNEPRRTTRVTRLFTCPKTNDDYQARFPLRYTSSDKIQGVRVLGVWEDNDDE